MMAGDGVPVDTIDIREVKFVYSREKFFREGWHGLELDQDAIRRSGHSTLDALLAWHMPLNILDYGSAGSLSTIRLRGAGSNHTRVSWNGFSLNSPTTGTFDLSLVPSGMIDNLKLVPGASGSLSGNSTFGGAIMLENEPDWSGQLQAELGTELGSFRDRRYFFSARTGNQNLQSDIRIIHQQALNNFSFHDIYRSGSPTVMQVHDAYRYSAVMQHLFLRLPGYQQLDMGLWYQSREKELPAIMGSYAPGTAMQADSSLRMYARWSRRSKQSVIHAGTAVLHEYLRYTDQGQEGQGVSAFYHTRQVQSTAEYRRHIGTQLVADAGASFEHVSAGVEYYGGNIEEEILQFYSGLRLNTKPLTANLSVRKPVTSLTKTPWLLAGEVRFSLVPGRLYTGAKLANRFRLPSLNERYWIPGGNPAIRPESGWGAEWMTEWHWKAQEQTSLQVRTNLYSSAVDNWIQWIPGPTCWSPVNMKKVWSRGLEMNASFRRTYGKNFVETGLNYHFTRATSVEAREYETVLFKQLPYTPEHSAGISFRLERKAFSIGARQMFMDKRFTTADNHPALALPAFTRTDVQAAYTMERAGFTAELGGKILNLFNHEYQLVRSYAMPGRSILINMNIRVKPKKEERLKP